MASVQSEELGLVPRFVCFFSLDIEYVLESIHVIRGPIHVFG
jgi:hypothetical protein